MGGNAGRDLVAEWSDPGFLEQATAWIDAVAEGRTGPLQPVKVRQWAGVWQVPLAGARHYFKVGNPGQAFEGSLLAALGRLVAGSVVAPVAVDDERGWWLMPDGGPTVRQSSTAASADSDWTALLAQTAALQRQVAGHRAELAMVPAVSLRTTPEYVGALIAELAALPSSHPQALTAQEATVHLRGVPALEAACELLAATGVPETLQPNDVHLNNACTPHDTSGAMRLFDLGDAVWSHPFGVLHMPLRIASGSSYTGPLPTGPVVDRLAGAYADCWRDEISGHDPGRLLRAADRIGCVHRIVSWQRLLAAVDPSAFADGPPRLSDWLAGACHTERG